MVAVPMHMCAGRLAFDSHALTWRMLRLEGCLGHSVLVLMGRGRIWAVIRWTGITVILCARRLRGKTVCLFVCSRGDELAHGGTRAAVSIRTWTSNL